jgi:hypothetical protein
MARKSFSKSLAEGLMEEGENTRRPHTSHPYEQAGTTQAKKSRKRIPIEVAHLRFP